MRRVRKDPPYDLRVTPQPRQEGNPRPRALVGRVLSEPASPAQRVMRRVRKGSALRSKGYTAAKTKRKPEAESACRPGPFGPGVTGAACNAAGPKGLACGLPPQPESGPEPE